MDEVGLSKIAARSLRAHIERRRRELSLAIRRSSGDGGRARGQVRPELVEELLERLCGELAPAAHETSDWGDIFAGLDEGGATFFTVAFAIVAASYAAEHPDANGVARFLALRSRQLDDARETAVLAKRSGDQSGAKVDRQELISSLLASLEARDFATCEHSRAVGSWSGRIATSLGIDGELRDFIAVCGTLHDVGKLATPRAILLKPGALDDDEWVTMRSHSAIGGRILGQIPSLRECAPVVRAHHERMDGTGYPDRLAGEAIPLAARIVAVADAFHAMISDRPYREAITATRALATLVEGKGTRWDAAAVDAMAAVVGRAGARRAALRVVGLDDRG
jgi:HD-GYP domain-containing protein (c-di-GMP phosphodiesterase class II)